MFSVASLLALSLNALLMVKPVTAAYSQVAAHYTPGNFFDGFDFFTGSDPTHGFVKYVDRNTAQNNGLIRNDGNSIYMGVDYWSYTSSGRQSVRLESKQRFQRGLFILDMQHMPGSICGTWPAFWTLGDNWPNNGEIDIIEGVHRNTKNHMALHTRSGCSINNYGFSGSVVSTNCDVNAPGQASNQGCAITDSRSNSYGDGFNNGGGGVYAMEWNADFIRIWFWPRGQIPGDVLGSNPEPRNWGTPAGQFAGNCNINNFFNQHKIIFDITFCGDWAGQVWNDAGCSNVGKTCIDYVAGQPGAFANSYWRINSLKVFSW